MPSSAPYRDLAAIGSRLAVEIQLPERDLRGKLTRYLESRPSCPPYELELAGRDGGGGQPDVRVVHQGENEDDCHQAFVHYAHAWEGDAELTSVSISTGGITFTFENEEHDWDRQLSGGTTGC